MSFEPLLPDIFDHAEGPVWSAADSALYFVDIPAFRVHRVCWESRRHDSWLMPSEPGSLAPCGDGTIVVALRDGFHHFEPSSGRLNWLAGPDHDRATMRFNDGRCDPAGRFWAGTMNTTRSAPTGGLWALDGGTLREGPQGVYISNGLAFSPDGRWMYHADSVTRIIRRYAYEMKSGDVGKGDIWFETSPEYGNPDGASVDDQGSYWIAMHGGRCLLRISSDGKHADRVDMPVVSVTMVTFGGPDLCDVIVTTGRRNRSLSELEKFPTTGCVLIGKIEYVRGLPENSYKI